ncbi:MAG: winged helix-turn-helix transcriptional regulator [Parvularculaceae bacterium]|jgi:DNA-binding transcriptional ArsR family regulator|nr:winged helix-turn-helix transcriptional regulator [Parvularculaceae bacterium]
MDDVYKALAHPVRRKILAMLRERTLSAGELSDAFDLAKPTLSGHFSVLKQAGLVSVERRGASLIYRANISVLEDALLGLLEAFRLGEAKPGARRTKPLKGAAP